VHFLAILVEEDPDPSLLNLMELQNGPNGVAPHAIQVECHEHIESSRRGLGRGDQPVEIPIQPFSAAHAVVDVDVLLADGPSDVALYERPGPATCRVTDFASSESAWFVLFLA
jgi:hypothetical protein